MTECNQSAFPFEAHFSRQVVAHFDGAQMTTDGGALLLRAADRKIGLLKRVARCFTDARDPERIEHTLGEMLAQRIYGLALGYEDLNDHDTLRHDLAWQTAVERDQPLASSPTLCRLENRADREVAWAVHQVIVDRFIASFAQPPTELILDFDATDDRVHGQQQGRFFHGDYGDYCFVPLYVFCGNIPLWAQLRTAAGAAADGAAAAIEKIIAAIRRRCPKVRIILRGDSGFAREELMALGEAQSEVYYCFGLQRNARLEARRPARAD
jgi:hypothetical protein